MVTILIVAWVALVLIQTILLSILLEHRTDIGRGDSRHAGPSWSWQLNVLLHAEYDERGQRVKRWVLALTAVQLVFLVVIVW